MNVELGVIMQKMKIQNEIITKRPQEEITKREPFQWAEHRETPNKLSDSIALI